MKKVVVIGSNSFSGSDFIDLLLQEEIYKVIGVSRSQENSSLFLPYKKRNLANFLFHQIDLNKEIHKFEQLIDYERPDYVINFAAQSEVLPSWANPHHWFQTNAVSVTQIANILKDKKYLKKYVHISTPEVYGSCEGSVLENAPLNPSTPYAASKAAGDLSLFTFAKNFDFPLVIVRATNVYGAHQQLFKIIPRTIIYLKLGKKIELHGGGTAVKSYIHIRDVSKGELMAMLEGDVNEIYHFSPDGGVSVREVVELICNEMGTPLEKSTVDVAERLGQDKAYVIDSTKARNKFHWSPFYTLNEGIKETINWINEEFFAIQQQPLKYVHKE